MVIDRGQIFWCDLNPVIGHEQGDIRPVVIVSSNSYNKSQSPLVAIVPLTRAAVKNPVHLAFKQDVTGLDADSTALIDHARFIDRIRLMGAPVGRLSPAALALVNRHMARVLGL